MSRVGAPRAADLMTSAPSPASNKPQYSAVSSAYSMTVRPEHSPARRVKQAIRRRWRSLVRAVSSVMMMCAVVQAFAALIEKASKEARNALYAIIALKAQGCQPESVGLRDIRNVMRGNAGAKSSLS